MFFDLKYNRKYQQHVKREVRQGEDTERLRSQPQINGLVGTDYSLKFCSLHDEQSRNSPRHLPQSILEEPQKFRVAGGWQSSCGDGYQHSHNPPVP